MSIATNIQRLITAKSNIKTAIEGKGVTVPSSATLDTYSTYISSIDTSSGGGGGSSSSSSSIYGTLIESGYSGKTTVFKGYDLLKEIVIPSGVTTAGNFYNAINLERVTFEQGSAFSGFTEYQVFRNCTKLREVIFPSSFRGTNTYLFAGCKALTNVSLPEGLEYIGNSAFQGCSALSAITLPTTITGMGESIFNEAGIKSIEMPSGLTEIKKAMFFVTPLTAITLPTSLVSIGNNAFRSTQLTSITLPEGLTTLGGNTFYASKLTSITLPSTITTLGGTEFYNCPLTSITCLATSPPTITSNTFNNTNNCPIYVPAESVETYKSASNWSSLASRIEAIS